MEKDKKIADDYGIPFMESLPLDPDLCRWSDSGTPAVLVMSESKIAQLYHALASAVVQEIAKRAFGNRSKVPQVVFDSDKCAIVISNIHPSDGNVIHNQVEWTPWELRNACRCALCVDEWTGMERPKHVDRNVKPLQIQSAGNYAFSVVWSDGHQSLYPFERVAHTKVQESAYSTTPASTQG